jgi:hypothetical protein
MSESAFQKTCDLFKNLSARERHVGKVVAALRLEIRTTLPADGLNR